MTRRKEANDEMEETSAPTFQLVVELGPHIGQTFTLSKASVSIGRAPGNDVVIEEPQVSRQHARLTRRGDLMVLEDLNSTNGTFVNGIRISGPHTLAHGDR
ncbi:MAG: FHA domain-containing protein, partial [Chloroflexi bacterium]